MSNHDYLSNLAATSLQLSTVIQPRLASLFEPTAFGVSIPDEGAASQPPSTPWQQTLIENHAPSQVTEATEVIVREQVGSPVVRLPGPNTATIKASPIRRVSKTPELRLSDERVFPLAAASPSQVTVRETPSVVTPSNELATHSRVAQPAIEPIPRVAGAVPSVTSPAQSAVETAGQVDSALPPKPALRNAERQLEAAIHRVLVAPSHLVVEQTLPAIWNQDDAPIRSLTPSPQTIIEPQVRAVVQSTAPTLMGSSVTAESTSTIQVTIGRIEVRAMPPPPKPDRAISSTAPMMSLDEYLRQRAQRGGG